MVRVFFLIALLRLLASCGEPAAAPTPAPPAMAVVADTLPAEGQARP
ncbi:MAG TPA: hypothetical protein PKD53_25690 [Chloroflexaceae bacterium]|nr:hypothetical protein [Chloroflexaceae bacterium]